MDAKNYLSQLFYIDKIVRADKEEIAKLETLLYGVQGCSFNEKVQSSFKSDTSKMTELIDKIDKVKRELLEDITRYMEIRSEIKMTILKVKDEKLKLLLRYRYIELLTWEDVGIKLGDYTLQWVHKLHAKALKEVEEILNS